MKLYIHKRLKTAKLKDGRVYGVYYSEVMGDSNNYEEIDIGDGELGNMCLILGGGGRYYTWEEWKEIKG
jgi:hypothetical protein